MELTKNFDSKNYEYNVQSNIGIYIVHGFTSSTFETKELAKYLSEKCYHTRTDNLPGHGTTVADCNTIKYREWLEFAEQKFAEMLAENDKMFIIGISMGAVLGMHLATLFPISGLVTAAPVFQFNDEKKLKWLNPWTKYFLPTLRKRALYDKSVRNKLKFFGYNLYPMKALAEFVKMTPIIKTNINQITAPILILYSENDATSIKSNLDIVSNEISSESKTILGYSNASHNLFANSVDQKKIFSEILKFIKINQI